MASLFSSVCALTRLTARSSTMTGARTLRSLVIQKRSFMLAHSASLRSQLIPRSFGTQLRYSSDTAGEVKAPVGVRFDSLQDNLHPDTLRALTKDMKLTTLSIVQEKILPMLPELAEPHEAKHANLGECGPRDLLVKSKTGTGKTLAFLVPAVEARRKAYDAATGGKEVRRGSEGEKRWNSFGRENVGTLIISPTRELATQIANEALNVVKHHKMNVKLFVGGESRGRQIRDFQFGTKDIVVATPGRLMDMLENEPDIAKPLKKTQMLILDEADTLLDMGFRDDIERIKTYLPPSPQRQTFLFSATVSRAIQQIAQSTLSSNHAFINCVSVDDSPVHAHIPQYHTVLPSAEHQIAHVMRLIAHDQLLNPGSSKVIVFFPTTKMTQLFSEVIYSLKEACLPVGRRTMTYEIHSRKSQQQRGRTSESFRSGRGSSVLATSDVSARGVDYPGVTRVIQVGIPKSGDQYIHRVGRTGRAGTSGRGDLVLLPWEMGFVKEALAQVPMKPITVNELETQVRELAAEVDADPAEFVRNTDGLRPSIRDFVGPITPKVENTKEAVNRMLHKTNPETVTDVFMSMLGYYAPMGSVLRTTKENILDGLKKWTTEGFMLESEPYVSQTMLQKVGMGITRSGSSSRGGGMRSGSMRSGGGGGWGGASRAPWAGRGSTGGGYGGNDRSKSFGDRDGGHGAFGRKSSFGGGYGGGDRKPFEKKRSFGYE